ncbi:MAG: FAD-binding oxidoreductase [Gammaproteobacteria bacterium]|jgi:ferredoxin-NADP reductase
MNHPKPLPADAFRVPVISVTQETSSIKSFLLDVSQVPFSYTAGQWIDLYVEIDGRYEVGGYSLTSSPLTEGRVQLAIKAARDHHVTRYMHEEAQPGSEVFISNGQGGFCFERGMSDALVLLGAGIGVTPLISILRYVAQAAREVDTTLVYSVSSPDEILFRDELDNLRHTHPNIRCVYTVTQPHSSWAGNMRRIDQRMLEELELPREALYYYCGSRSFIEDMTVELRDMGVAESHLRYEKWW